MYGVMLVCIWSHFGMHGVTLICMESCWYDVGMESH